MVAFDCVHESHESARFTAETRLQLLEKVLPHFDSYHPELSEGEVIDLVSASAYDPEVRARALARLEPRAVGAGAELVEPETSGQPFTRVWRADERDVAP